MSENAIEARSTHPVVVQVEMLVMEADLFRSRCERLERVIRWALGESPEGMPEFPRRPDPVPGKPHPLYWWRVELAKLAALEA